MPNRAARRAAERLAQKAAVNQQANQQQPPQTNQSTHPINNPDNHLNDAATSQTPPPRHPPSDAKLAANRANAQKSSGPVTPEGKSKSSLNAVKCNLTGNSILFATEAEASRYAAHVAACEKMYEPVGPEESALTQSITDIRWRLNRIPGLEQAIITLGSQQLIEENPSLAEPQAESALILEVRRQHEKELRNLALQENRLTRRREREAAELERIQTARKQKEEADRKQRDEESLRTAAKTVLLAKHRNLPDTDVSGLGFVFSKLRLQEYMAALSPAQTSRMLQEALEEESQNTQTQEAAA